MTLALDPIIGNFFFTLNLFLHLHKPSSSPPYSKPNPNNNVSLPPVDVLIPVFKERREALERTLSSLAKQTYPRGKLKVWIIAEEDDVETIRVAREIADKHGLNYVLEYNAGGRRLKPAALNSVLPKLEGEWVCVYDADDEFPANQIEMAVKLGLEKGSDIVQAKVFRINSSLLGKLLMLDTYTWWRKIIPTVYKYSKAIPLSGEGMFVKLSKLKEVGGFPEVLAEDAALGLKLANVNGEFTLLDSPVYEKAPRNWKAHLKQRIRWFRGYLSCIPQVLKLKIPFKRKLVLLIPFLAPLTCFLSLISITCFALFWITFTLDVFHVALPVPSFIAPWMTNIVYALSFYWWSLFLAYIGNFIVIYSLAQTISDTRMEKYAPLALLSPLYWLFIGLAAFLSYFRSKHYWGKTVR